LLLGITILIMSSCQSAKEPLGVDSHRLQPAIQIVTPSNNSAVSGEVKIIFMITNLVPDSLEVIELWIDDTYSGWNTTTVADSIEWDTVPYEDGSAHALCLKLYPDSARTFASDPVMVVVNNLKSPHISELDPITCLANNFYISWSKNTSRDFKSYSLYESGRPDLGDSVLIYYSADINDTSCIVSGIAAEECRFYKLVVSDSSDLTAASITKPASATGENGFLLYYFKIWKDLFMSRNQISQDYYDTHLEITSREIFHWQSGISFRLYYKLHIDWAEIQGVDDFLIVFFSTESGYQHLSIRRDVYLTKAEIEIVLDNHVFSSCIGPVNPVKNLLFTSYDQAVAAFQATVNCAKIFPQQTAYYVPGKLPRIDGDPYFIGLGTLDSLNNRCISGYFNLMTGIGLAHETVCVIIN
jgi:hypothetical protein